MTRYLPSRMQTSARQASMTRMPVALIRSKRSALPMSGTRSGLNPTRASPRQAATRLTASTESWPAGRDIAERAAPVADQPGDRPRRHERDDEGDEAQHQRQLAGREHVAVPPREHDAHPKRRPDRAESTGISPAERAGSHARHRPPASAAESL